VLCLDVVFQFFSTLLHALLLPCCFSVMIESWEQIRSVTVPSPKRQQRHLDYDQRI
jgi:hypothetical protein